VTFHPRWRQHRLSLEAASSFVVESSGIGFWRGQRHQSSSEANALVVTGGSIFNCRRRQWHRFSEGGAAWFQLSLEEDLQSSLEAKPLVVVGVGFILCWKQQHKFWRGQHLHLSSEVEASVFVGCSIFIRPRKQR